MSFVPLDRVEYSREESIGTPMRLRGAGRCKSPTPASDASRENISTHRSREASRVQPTPARQPTIPRHRRACGELLDSINESVTELRDEMATNPGEMTNDRVADICRKLDVIANVVLRHDRELQHQTALVAQLSGMHQSSRNSDESQVIDSILAKVNEVNAMIHNASRTFPGKQRTDESFLPRRDVATPLFRIADALDSVTKEVQRQHATIDRLVRAQAEREDEERVKLVMSERPPSVIGSDRESSRNSSRIQPNEASPRRQRQDISPGDFFEADIDESPRRARNVDQALFTDSTVPTKTQSWSAVRTVTKQPEFLLNVPQGRSSAKKPVCRADIFDNSSDQSTRTPARCDETRSEESRSRTEIELIAKLQAENESLKEQLYRQLTKNDDLRAMVQDYQSTPRSRPRATSSRVF